MLRTIRSAFTGLAYLLGLKSNPASKASAYATRLTANIPASYQTLPTFARQTPSLQWSLSDLTSARTAADMTILACQTKTASKSSTSTASEDHSGAAVTPLEQCVAGFRVRQPVHV